MTIGAFSGIPYDYSMFSTLERIVVVLFSSLNGSAFSSIILFLSIIIFYSKGK